MNLCNWPKFQKLHIYPHSTPRGRNWTYFHSMFLRYGQIFKIAISGHETGPLPKVPEVAHILSFYPRWSKLSLFSLYRQRFPRYGQIFKIAIFGHETWLLAQIPEVAHIIPSASMGRNWAYFFSMGSGFRQNFQNCHIWHETWPLVKVPEVAHIHSFYLRGSKLSLFSLYRQLFPRYGPIFKTAIFGHETWPLAKVQEVAHTPCLPQGGEIELIFVQRAAVSEKLADFQNCLMMIFAHETWPFDKVSEVAHTPFVPQGVEIEVIFNGRATVKQIEQFFFLNYAN